MDRDVTVDIDLNDNDNSSRIKEDWSEHDDAPHFQDVEEVFAQLGTTVDGLSTPEVNW